MRLEQEVPEAFPQQQCGIAKFKASVKYTMYCLPASLSYYGIV